MKYLPAMLILITLFVMTTSVFSQEENTGVWTPPEECADEDRQIPGNRRSPCQYIIPELKSVEYRVEMNYPDCVGILLFNMPGIKPFPPEFYGSGFKIANVTLNSDNDRYRIWAINDYIVKAGYRIGLLDKVPSNSNSLPSPNTIDITLLSYSSVWGNVTTNTVPFAWDSYNISEMFNTCLLLVEQEEADRKHSAKIERQKEEQAAQIAADADAIAKEQEQAIREAESQAELARLQLAAVQAEKLAVGRIEALRTETLTNELKHKEVIAGIVNEIVRVRLGGQEDRARLTNEHLTLIRATQADFDEETTEIETRIQEYLDFNDELLISIGEYQVELQTRLDSLEQALQDQLDALDKVEQTARDTATEAEDETFESE